VCEACLRGEGAECHTPGCALFLKAPFTDGLRPELYEILNTLADPIREYE